MNSETTENCYLVWLLGVVIEEITEEEDTGESKKPSKEATGAHRESNTSGVVKTDVDGLQALRDDPEAIRFKHHSDLLLSRMCCFVYLSPNHHLKTLLILACRTFQNFISKTDPETLASLSGGKAGDMSPDMFKTASSMIGKMSPEEIQKMVQTASSFKGDNPFASTAPSGENGFAPTPDMLKLASDMMSKMSPEERERMFNMASSLKANAPVSTSNRDAEATEPRESSFAGESSYSGNNSFTVPRSGLEPSIASAPPADLQEQMRNQMKDPAMRQVSGFVILYILHKCDCRRCVYIL